MMEMSSTKDTAQTTANQLASLCDFSSTLSIGQSQNEVATLTRSNFYLRNTTFRPGFFENYNKNEEDYLNRQVPSEHNQSLAGISHPSSESYFRQILSTYGPNYVICPHQVVPARVVLPLDCTTEGIPIYVNAKQYNAILRRRQTRAKMEAQNKMAKSRKPYLHESRHLHALKRARGSGGRFLNTKNTQELNPLSKNYDKHPSLEQPDGDASSSNIPCIFNSSSCFTMGATGRIGAHSRVIAPDDRLILSIDRCTRISTAT